jgi:hypothetical protein
MANEFPYIYGSYWGLSVLITALIQHIDFKLKDKGSEWEVNKEEEEEEEEKEEQKKESLIGMSNFY